MTPRELGRRGERRAAWFYRLRGYRILERNARLPAGEKRRPKLGSEGFFDLRDDRLRISHSR